jgi:hypothetical protein
LVGKAFTHTTHRTRCAARTRWEGEKREGRLEVVFGGRRLLSFCPRNKKIQIALFPGRRLFHYMGTTRTFAFFGLSRGCCNAKPQMQMAQRERVKHALTVHDVVFFQGERSWGNVQRTERCTDMRGPLLSRSERFRSNER